MLKLTQHSNMSHESKFQQAAPRLQDVPRYVPTYEQKVGAYMHINATASASLIRQSPSYDYRSALDATLREDDEPTPFQPPDSTQGAIASDSGTHFEKNMMYKRRMGLSLFILLMSRCQTLQGIVDASECKPQTQKARLDIQTNYSKIFSYSQEARKVAEELESVALEARSEYWAGRGCGGLRDWQAATMHFTNAIRLDASHSNPKYMTSHFGGLLPHEKEDVEFLLQNAKQRYNEWTNRGKKIQKKQHDRDIEDESKVPSWMPNPDFRNWAAKQQLEMNQKAGRRMNIFLPKEGQKVRKLWKHEIPMIRTRLATLDVKHTFRRTLNTDEWFYILRGNSTTEDANTNTNNQSETEEEPGGTKDIPTPPAGSSPVPSLKQSPLDSSHNLDDELQQLGYLETRPPSAASSERMIQPDDEADLPLSPARASLRNQTSTQTTLPHIDPSEKGADWSGSVSTLLSETDSARVINREVEDDLIEKVE